MAGCRSPPPAPAIISASLRRCDRTSPLSLRERSDEAIQTPSFRDGPKDQTSDVQLHIGESRDSGFDAAHRPGMTEGNDQGTRMKHDPVDVLIIGAGASGAAVAWSLAETKMHILCLDQGGWMNPAAYPSTGRDWEARFFGDYSPSPNIRARPEDYPINDDNSPIKVVNFNGVGGSTVMYTAHFPRLHPSDFRVKALDGVADDWPIDYDMLVPFFEENDRIMGVSGLPGDPRSPL